MADQLTTITAQKPIPALDWHYAPVEKLAAALRARKLSALELLDHTITRIEALDQRINAVVVRDFGRARAAAKSADAALAHPALSHNNRQPLLGIPVTVKEAFNVAGLPTTWGFPQFKSYMPTEDALVVTRMKSAGAIVIGKTNVPTGLADFQSYNDIHGTTRNPWDLTRSPGGSSGGSAAALAAGFGPLSFGSDIGGSLRVPAHFCGVYAHKPTLGLVPMRGYGPPASPPLPGHGDLAVIGPMARTAADLALALDIAAGPDEQHAGIGYRLALPPPRHSSLNDYRVFVIDAHPLVPTAASIRDATNRLADRLEKSGATIGRTSASLPDLAGSARLYRKLLGSAKSASMPTDEFEQAQRRAASLAREANCLGAAHLRGTAMTHRDWLIADAARARLQQQWRAFFREWDVVLYPAASIPAFPHDHALPIEARRLDIDGASVPFYDALFTWADPATTCGLPATAAPIDHTPAGLPIGVQIVGPFLEDRTTIAFAGLLEREFGGFTPPPAFP